MKLKERAAKGNGGGQSMTTSEKSDPIAKKGVGFKGEKQRRKWEGRRGARKGSSEGAVGGEGKKKSRLKL